MNIQAYKVTYKGATDHSGSCYIVKDINTGARCRVPYPYDVPDDMQAWHVINKAFKIPDNATRERVGYDSTRVYLVITV